MLRIQICSFAAIKVDLIERWRIEGEKREEKTGDSGITVKIDYIWMERVFYRRRSISGGVRRLFFSCLLKDSSSSTINTNSTTTRFIIDVHGKLEGDEEGEGNSMGVGELDCSRIRCIRVPKRTKVRYLKVQWDCFFFVLNFIDLSYILLH